MKSALFASKIRTLIVAAIAAAAPLSGQAGPMLFVSDSTTDTSIATVLTGAGYSVTSFTNQYNSGTGETAALSGSLSAYDAIFWSATGSGTGSLNSNAAMLANLSSYVSAGGRVFVTGYDSIASPDDPSLKTFLGGSLSVDTCGAPGAIANVANSLTTGVVDIRGALPGTTGNQTCDRDGLGGLAGGTVGIVASGGSPGFYQWTLRALGSGEIAYVSNGNTSGSGESTMWTNGSAYNSAVLNFAFNAPGTNNVPAPAGLLLLALGLGLLAWRRLPN